MVRIPPSIPHGTQALLLSKFCLLAPEKRARIVSRSGERCVRIAEVEGSIPFESTKRKCDLSKQVAFSFGAADGSRTHLCSLGSCRSTDELQPQERIVL